MSLISINKETYQFVSDYKNSDALRKSFNSLTQKIFEFDLEDFYQNGYWNDSYIPYSLMHNNQIVANVSISHMNFQYKNRSIKAIQLGTVMTDPNFRNKGLSKYLIERVLYLWKQKSDFIYLFANSSVFDFYQQFGFQEKREFACSIKTRYDNDNIIIRKLDLSKPKELQLLIDTINNSKNFKKLSHINNFSLMMFYTTQYFQNDIYYLEDKNTILIMEKDNDVLTIHDIFSREDISINDIANCVSTKDSSQIRLGFTPKEQYTLNFKKLIEPDSKLFVINDKADFIQNDKLRFPFLSRT